MINTTNDREQPLINHLRELRSRVLKAGGIVFIVFLLLLPFINQIYSFIAAPLVAKLPTDSRMIATEVASPFLTPLKLGIFTAVFISIPYIIYQIWAFIGPALYTNEKKIVFPLLGSSIVLFYMGGIFAYFVVFPLLFAFFTATAPEGILIMTDINHYFNFILKLFFAFGISFEIPIATFLLISGRFISIEKLAAHRAYVILIAFIIGMLLTPPDVISQILLAVPIWLLFEIGLILSRYWLKQNNRNKKD